MTLPEDERQQIERLLEEALRLMDRLDMVGSQFQQAQRCIREARRLMREDR